MGRPALSAKDIKEALEERILRGQYPRGGALPSVRHLGAELGASPSTVSRALQELEREGWIQVVSRRGAVVARQLPHGERAHGDVEAALQRLAMRWRLSGRRRDELEEVIGRVVDDVFQPEPIVYFLECNPVDLARMTGEVQREASEHRVVPLLIDDARDDPAQLAGCTVIVPFFHLADVRAFLQSEVDLVPLHFSPSEEFMRTMADLSPDTRVGVIARDERSRRRLEGLVHQYSLARTETSTVEDTPTVQRLLDESDVVVTANSAGLSEAQLKQAKQLLVVEFALENGELDLARLLLQEQTLSASDAS